MRLVSRLLRAGVALLIAATAVVAPIAPAQHSAKAALNTSWTQYHYDDAHTGSVPGLPQVQTVNAGWASTALDQEIFASPLVFNGVVYAATLNNTVYALNESSGAIIWSKHVGTPRTSGWGCGNINPTGILGTPIIDPAAKILYAVAEISTGTNSAVYRLFALNLAASGAVLWSSNLAPGGFDWTIEQERGALALHGGYVFVPFGGRAGDCGNYHGYVMAVPTGGTSHSVTGVWVTQSSGMGIWSGGGIVVDDATGNLFVSTGNGTGSGCDTTNGLPGGPPQYENDSIARLRVDSLGGLHHDGTNPAFMPQDWKADWCDNDEDLGSASPVLISPNLLFAAGKWGGGFLLNPNNLGGVNGQIYPSPTNYTQAEVCFGNHSDATFGAFAYSAPFVYVECEGGNGIVALNVNTSNNTFVQCDATCSSASDWEAGSGNTYGPPIVAAGAVWAVSDGNGLTAFNAATGAVIFQSAGFGVNRFVSPAESDGIVFVPSNNVIRTFDMVSLTWSSLGLTSATGPEASANSGTAENVFAGVNMGAGGVQVETNHWNGTSWGGWSNIGYVTTADPGATGNGASRIDLFWRGSDNQLYHGVWNGSSWSAAAALGGVLTSGADASLRPGTPSHVDVWVAGSDHQLYHKWSDDGGVTFGAWQALGGYLTSDARAVSWSATRVDVFVRGSDNQLYHKWWSAGSPWSQWQALGGILNSAPDVTSCAVGHLDVFVLGSDNGLWHRGWNGSSWSGWQSLGGTWTSSPSAQCRPGTSTIDLFERGTNNAIWTTTTTGS